MRLQDLDLRELLDFDPKGGVLRFGGERAVILDAVALGLLRRELIDTLGLAGARAVLTRFGFAHGWRTAEAVRTGFPWDTHRDWELAGGRLHTLQGLLRLEPLPESEGAFAEALWHDSYEAEQHVLHLGKSDEPVCWTHCGFASGYMSRVQNREVYVLETACVGRGDSVCHMQGRFREDWSEERQSELVYFERGALDESLEQLTSDLKKTERALHRRRRELQKQSGEEVDPSGIVAASSSMRRLLETARRVAAVDTNVLVTGESGVGKERLARLIHEESPRRLGPLLAVNCGALPEGLLESELFGHVRGAFTGASSDREGLFEAARGGTLFLDEVGEITPAVQVRLLRVLQEREVRRVGDNQARPIDVRIVAATNRDLGEEIRQGRFREDLYYRLRVVELPIPPLRERTEDILPLARWMLRAHARDTGQEVSGFTPEAADQLLRYDWPGNVRELDNAVQRGTVMTTGRRIGLEALPEEVRSALPSPRLSGDVRPLEEVEREYILAALEANGGNRKRTAEQLQIGTVTLYRRLKKYGVS
jgi:DNA-binding NtrC family response regulator